MNNYVQSTAAVLWLDTHPGIHTTEAPIPAHSTEQSQAFLQEDILCIIYTVLMRDDKEG